jgi:predicted Rossmann fold flavoprotein
MLAAARAAQRQRRTLLLEKNRKPGAKILMSGGTRCNLTHDTDPQGIVEAFGRQGRFLHSAVAGLSPRALVGLFEAEGVSTKVEPGGKIFPASDHAYDVCQALLRILSRSGCLISLGESLVEIRSCQEGWRLVTSSRTIVAQKVVLASGGQSYPGCGTCGDGYRWAESVGHTVVPRHPALVPLTTAVPWVPALKGITVSDVLVQVVEPQADRQPSDAARCERCLEKRRASFLFTHFGLSGPAALDVSRAVSGHPQRKRLTLVCDFLPAFSDPQLDSLLREQCAAGGKRLLAGIVDQWLPRRLVETLLQQADIAADRRAAELAKPERQRLLQAVKHLRIPLTGTLGFEKAEVTAGGVSLDEVDSRTMESKLCPGLYFAGELLDLDGPIGGYNFHAAFSTGWHAGNNV